MTLWTELARAVTASGDTISLRRRGQIFEITFNGLQLMSNLNHQSEDILALKAARLCHRPPARVLVAGLGMGFTLRAVLEATPEPTQVTVCEIVPEIAGWCRGPLAALAGDPLADPRVRLVLGDVGELLQRDAVGFDLILMDTDNGPEALARKGNAGLYEDEGIGAVLAALRPGGIAAFWSADRSDAFGERLTRAGADWRCDAVALIPGRVDALHHIYFIGAEPASSALRLAA